MKPSQLQVKDDGTRPGKELQRFRSALEEAKFTVGLTFDSSSGYIFIWLFRMFVIWFVEAN
jgi:hypothetical protein